MGRGPKHKDGLCPRCRVNPRGEKSWCRPCRVEYGQAWNEAHRLPGQRRMKVNGEWLGSKWKGMRARVRAHNTTPGILRALYIGQRGECAICHDAYTLDALVIDHDHACCNYAYGKSCGKCIRGLLCTSCNTALGWYESASAILMHNYLA